MGNKLPLNWLILYSLYRICSLHFFFFANPEPPLQRRPQFLRRPNGFLLRPCDRDDSRAGAPSCLTRSALSIWILFSHQHWGTHKAVALAVRLLLREDILASRNGNERTMVMECWKDVAIILDGQKRGCLARRACVHACARVFMNDSCGSTTQKLRVIFIWRLRVVHIMFDRILASKHSLMDKGNNYLSFMCLRFLCSPLLLLLNMFLC